MFDIENTSHRRLNILTGEWILVSPHRTKRPWQGKVENVTPKNVPEYDKDCYLCPGNERAGGEKNPNYDSTFSFTNDFSALIPTEIEAKINDENLIIAESDSGICRVLCFSPRHDLSIAVMDQKSLTAVVDMWIKEFKSLSEDPSINCVTIFENKGELMGCSNRHPHGQIWAQKLIPNEIRKESIHQRKYYDENQNCLLCGYLKKERELDSRLIYENDDFVSLVPYWAVWPYETIIIPKFHAENILSLNESQKLNLAEILKIVTVRYDNLFETSFPYSMGFHQAPTDNASHPEWHWHIHFYPPLLRSASVKKFMVGYEMLAMAQRDITPESAAEILKNIPKTHYLLR